MRPFIAAFLIFTSLPACAQVTLGGGIEYFSWTEDTQPIKVKESGPLGVFTVGYTQPRERGFLFAYRGEVYFGDVNYDGALLFSPNVPASSQTQYIGMAHEAQVRYRTQGFDVLGTLGIDVWNRQLSTNQQEDYRVAFVRLGIEYDTGQRGWLFSAGAKYPVWTQENAHFNDLGFDQNPMLTPGKEVSGFASAGYRFDSHWSVLSFFDSYRFGQSNTVFVTSGGVPQGGFVQPATDTYVLGVRAQYSF